MSKCPVDTREYPMCVEVTAKISQKTILDAIVSLVEQTPADHWCELDAQRLELATLRVRQYVNEGKTR